MAQLFDNSESKALGCSVQEFLCSSPSNPYTTMRMSNSKGVFELEMHLDRVKAAGKERLVIKDILEQLQQKNPRDLRVTLIRSGRSGVGFDLIYEAMPAMEMASCQVEIQLARRQNVHEKNSQWVKDRKRLEESKAVDSNEVILMDEAGRLYEGLSSNFFVIRPDNSIQTAPLASVLPGTIMKRILTEETVVFEYPLVGEAGEWLGAFITSTSRLILPIHQIKLSSGRIIAIPLNERVQRLRERFQSMTS